MTRTFLRDLGLEDAMVDKIMAENGRDIEREKGRAVTIETELSKLREKLESAEKLATEQKAKLADAEKRVSERDALAESLRKESEGYKKSLEKQKGDYDTLSKETSEKLSRLEREAKVKDYISDKKFVNTITRDAIAKELVETLSSESAKGLSLDALFEKVTSGKKDVFKVDSPTPPVVAGPKADVKASDASLRSAMGLGAVK